MARSIGVLFLATALMASASGVKNPLLRVWLVNPAAARLAPDAPLRKVLPEVHDVEAVRGAIVVHSAGLTLNPLGALQANEHEPSSTVKKLAFRIPDAAVPAEVRVRTPDSVVGVLIWSDPVNSVT